jgi:hypothetical protein
MAVLTLYLDNSILGGYFDSEFEEPTQRLWRLAEAGECRFVASIPALRIISPLEIVYESQDEEV